MIELALKDKFQIQYLLPVTGNIENLKTVQKILDKLNIQLGDEHSADLCEIDLEENEIDFIVNMILILDQAHKLHIGSLPVITKFLSIKETK